MLSQSQAAADTPTPGCGPACGKCRATPARRPAHLEALPVTPADAQELAAWFWRAGARPVRGVRAVRQPGDYRLRPRRRGLRALGGAVEAAAPGLVGRLVIESTPSGGRHVAYRCEAPVGGSAKLASKRIKANGPVELVVGAKAYRPRRDAEGRWHVMVTTIETRGEGGVFLCAPSEGYELVQGDLCTPPVPHGRRARCAQCARASTNPRRKVVDGTAAPGRLAAKRCCAPATTSTRGRRARVLRAHGWRLVHPGDNEHWCRPGKEHGTSATLRGGVFYVFSNNAPPFEAQKGYAHFAVYALLEHGGDFAAAASALRARGYGAQEPAGDVDLSAFSAARQDHTPAPGPPDPGPVPPSLLRVPGFVGEVMDHCLATAPYPNPTLAFCGALALQAFLAGRKVRDPGDNRTNLYLLGLAHRRRQGSSCRLNTRILHEAGSGRLPRRALPPAARGSRTRSSRRPPCSSRLTRSTAAPVDQPAKDARHEAIMSTLLTMYSSASGVFLCAARRARSRRASPDQPCSGRLRHRHPQPLLPRRCPMHLTNGFFARMIILESGLAWRGTGAEHPRAACGCWRLPSGGPRAAGRWQPAEHPTPASSSHGGGQSVAGGRAPGGRGRVHPR
ncbi:MAG: hypothetical protein H6811_12055 [Phycisphaeraceae bacterium]|nr:hypothetical protein [Phycisphaeraceae bacterium]